MRAVLKWLLRPIDRLFEDTWSSGAESCDYLARLKAVPAIDAREDRRAA